MLRVLISIPCLNRGGTEMQTLYLVRALALSGYEVIVLCYFEHDRSVVDEFRVAGCEIRLMHMERSVRQTAFVGKLRNAIAECRPDVVHVQYMTPGALAIIAARLAGIRTVLATVHQPYSAWHSPKWKLMLRLSAVLCNHFIAVSQVAESSWFGSSCNYTGNLPHRLPRHFTLHNAVDVLLVETLSESGKASGLREKIGLSANFVFGYVGRLSNEKGVDILLDAFGKLALDCKDVNLLIVGDGPEKAVLVDRYSRMPWWNRVIFAGAQSWENAMKHFSAMDAVIVPSRFEGFGLSAVEAMAASKPVIASKAGGLSEIIENRRNGLLFESENSEDLLAKMMILFEKSEIKEKLARNARIRSLMFDVSVFNEKIHNLYKLIVL